MMGYWEWLFNFLGFLWDVIKDHKWFSLIIIYVIASFSLLWFFVDFYFDIYFTKSVFLFSIGILWLIGFFLVEVYVVYMEEVNSK